MAGTPSGRFIKGYLFMAFVLIYFATMLFSIAAPDCFEDVVLTTGQTPHRERIIY